MYGRDAPFDERAQPIAEQRLAVNNAYVDIRAPRRRLLVAKRSGQARKYVGDTHTTIDIHKYDLLFEEVGRTGKRVNMRTQTSTSIQTTLYANASLCQIGEAAEPHWETRKRVRYLGFAGTRAETNLLGEDDRMMLPVFNGGIIDILNKWDRVIAARTFLKFTIPKDMIHVAQLKNATGKFTGEDPERITPFLSEYDPKDQYRTVEFIRDAVTGKIKGNDGVKLHASAVENRDQKKVTDLPVYSATQFGDAIAVLAAAVAIAYEGNVEDADLLYEQLKTKINSNQATVTLNIKDLLQDAFNASTKGSTVTGLDRHYHASMSAVFRLFADMKAVGHGFDTEKPNLGARDAEVKQLFRYFINKDNAAEKTLHSIKSATSLDTRDVVAISLTGAAPGRPMRVLILQ